MAEIARAKIRTPLDAEGVQLWQWTPMVNGDTGAPIIVPAHADVSIQVEGTFGAGGSVAAEGSNKKDSPTWAALNDPQGTTIAITSAAIEQVLENAYQMRPHVTAGDGTTSLTVTMLVRR